MNEHLIIQINEQYNFKKVTCIEGHYLTDWDKNDILEYSATKVMFCPIKLDLSPYYCIDEEEHNNLMEQQLEKMKEMEENRD